MSEESKRDAELRQIVTDALVSMVSCVTGLVPPTGPGQIPDFIQAPIDRAVEKISASLPVGVPDGYMPIPTAEQLADALESVRCFHDMSAELIAPELLANLLAAPTVKESLSVAPSLPAAGSADQQYPDGMADDLERSDWTPIEALQWYATGKHFDVVGGRTRIIDTGAVASNALKHASLAYLELKGDAELSELRAALSAQQSAHVSVPRELLQDLRDLASDAVDHHRQAFAGYKLERQANMDQAIASADALLNGGEA